MADAEIRDEKRLIDEKKLLEERRLLEEVDFRFQITLTSQLWVDIWDKIRNTSK
jgi:hypothetical protein